MSWVEQADELLTAFSREVDVIDMDDERYEELRARIAIALARAYDQGHGERDRQESIACNGYRARPGES